MDSEGRHYFQEREIEIKWRIANGQSQNNQIQQQQITYEYTPARQDQDLGMGSGQGGLIKFNNGQELPGYSDQSNQYFIWQNNGWIPIEQIIAEYQQQIPQQMQQQQNQNDEELQFQVEVIDQKNINSYQGHITARQLEDSTDQLGQLEDLQQELKEKVQTIFDNHSSVQLKMTHQDALLDFQLEQMKGRKKVTFPIQILLKLKEQKQEDKEKIKKDKELNIQNQRLDKIEDNLKIIIQSSREHKEYIEQSKSQHENQKTELSSQISNLQQNVQKQHEQLNQFKQNSKNESEQIVAKLSQFESQMAQLSNYIQQVAQHFQEQFQQQIKQQQDNFQKFSITDMKPMQHPSGNVNVSKKLQGQFELEFSIADHDINFIVGFIQDDNLEGIENEKKSCWISSDGQFTRGQTEFGKLFTHKLYLDDKLGLRVDTIKHLFQLVINDQPFPPIKFKDTIEAFSFVIKSTEDIVTFAQDPNQQQM